VFRSAAMMQTPTPKGVSADEVTSTVKSYLDLHHDSPDSNTADQAHQRKVSYVDLVNHYYNLVTDFYEWGWGQSFHFAIQHYSESFSASIARHEHYLALRMGLGQGMKILDVGCGVGGPARNISFFAGCNVTGLNNNQYQVDRAIALNKKHGLSHLVSMTKSDFMNQPFEDNTFDGAYQIEATAHAPSKVECYREILRVLKPGQIFAGYEWCLTNKYNPEDPEHRRIKKGIEEGDGLPDISTCDQVEDALREAGFEVLECRDLATNEPNTMPWYYHLTPSYTSMMTPARMQFTPAGKWLTTCILSGFETIHLIPKGTCAVNQFLFTAADSLAKGGELGIFTAVFFHMARKPLSK